jgi:hypothetical protein
VEKYGTARQATDVNMAHALCMLDKMLQTRGIYKNHYFSAATMVARTRLRITLYVYCLSL